MVSRLKERAGDAWESLLRRPRTGRVLAWLVMAVRVVLDDWRRDRIAGLAAEVAFWGTLSIFPALLVCTSALGFLSGVAGQDVAQQAQEHILSWLSRTLGATSQGVVDTVRQLFERPSPNLFSVGLIALIWTAARGFNAVIRALDVVYSIDEMRSWIRLRLLALALAFGSLLVGSLTIAMLVAGPLLGRGSGVVDALGLGATVETVWTWVRLPLGAAILIAWATTVFHVAPHHQQRTPWRWDLPGALLTAALWLIGHVGLLVYLDVASQSANAVFGILGGALTLMLWLYVLALGVLLGGELNFRLALERGLIEDEVPLAETYRPSP